MSWTPTDELREQTANAAASAENEHFELCGDTHSVYEHIADAVLVAVGPHIAAQALRDAAAMQDEESARIREAYRQHNAIRDPNRPPRRPDLNVWSNADEATAHRLRARADTVEKEAGR